MSDESESMSVAQAKQMLESLVWNDTDCVEPKIFSWDADSDEEFEVEALLQKLDVIEDRQSQNEENQTEKSLNNIEPSINSTDTETPEYLIARKYNDPSNNEEMVSIVDASVSFNISKAMLQQWTLHVENNFEMQQQVDENTTDKSV
jgi:hypothetical protein